MLRSLLSQEACGKSLLRVCLSWFVLQAMLGGQWFHQLYGDSLGNDEIFVHHAMKALHQHLDIRNPQPTYVKTTILKVSWPGYCRNFCSPPRLSHLPALIVTVLYIEEVCFLSGMFTQNLAGVKLFYPFQCLK